MGRRKRTPVREIRVVIEPIQAPAAEYERAWIGALELVARLHRRMEAKALTAKHPVI